MAGRAYDHARKVMGEDYWPYGAHENKHALETLARYSFQQGLSVRQVPLEEMFAKPTYELTEDLGAAACREYRRRARS